MANSGDERSCDRDIAIDKALRLMERHEVHRLPVVEEDGKLVGIVARADKQTGDVVEDIEVGETVFLLNVSRGSAHTAQVLSVATDIAH